MKLSFLQLFNNIERLSLLYADKINKILQESEMAHDKILQESGWSKEEYFECLNKHKSHFHKNF